MIKSNRIRALDYSSNKRYLLHNPVILETEWVLCFAYNFKPDEICAAFRNLFGLPNVQVTNGNMMLQVLQWHEQGLDFADAVHLAQSQNCDGMYTFDDKFVKRSKGLSNCEVRQA